MDDREYTIKYRVTGTYPFLIIRTERSTIRHGDDQTIKARGLYLDTVKGKVARRAYDKFFNIGECRKTRLNALQRRMRFPTTAFVKENRFLGIASFNSYENALLTACNIPQTADLHYGSKKCWK